MRSVRTSTGAITLIAVLALALAGCGGDSDKTAETSATEGSAQPGRPGGAFGDIDFDKIRTCLEAAGLGDKLPTDLPTDRPTDLPTDRPTDLPSEMPTDLPTNGGPGGGAFAALQDPDVQEALTSCGIDLPQPGGNQP